MKRDTLTDLEDIGNSIGNSFKDMVGLETNNNIIDDLKNIDVSDEGGKIIDVISSIIDV